VSLPLVDRAAAVLLDFDGPVATMFAGCPSPSIAVELRARLTAGGGRVPSAMANADDPLAVLRLAAAQAPQLIAELDEVLTAAEERAAGTARPVPGAGPFLRQCNDQGKPVVIVSNNSRAGVLAYLEVQGLRPLIAEVFGRPVHRPDLMKPNPTIVRAALDHLQVPAESTVLVGDSVSDIEAARASRIPGVGLANRAGKRVQLATAGATIIIDSLGELLAGPHPC
jgi:HAD superfamily hydrolase (TIGR01549 family)